MRFNSNAFAIIQIYLHIISTVRLSAIHMRNIILDYMCIYAEAPSIKRPTRARLDDYFWSIFNIFSAAERVLESQAHTSPRKHLWRRIAYCMCYGAVWQPNGKRRHRTLCGARAPRHKHIAWVKHINEDEQKNHISHVLVWRRVFARGAYAFIYCRPQHKHTLKIA